MKKIVTVIIVVIIALSGIFQAQSLIPKTQAQVAPDVFVGIDIAYNASVPEIKNLIDQYSPYTNLIEFGCWGLTQNMTSLNQACQYAHDKGLNFMVYTQNSYFGNLSAHQFHSFSSWASNAKAMWGNQFLGLYVLDELGGYQIDLYKDKIIQQDPSSFSNCTNQYVSSLNFGLNMFRNRTNPALFSLYTSDYAEYWFDYKAGYDTVFTEIGWGSDQQTKQQNIALCRGAATMQNHDWGAIITWNSIDSQTVESGPALLDDLKLAYKNGAKYISVFDSNKAYTESTLTGDQKQVLKDFWQYVQANPQHPTPVAQRVAFVLPKNYGAAFRGPDDTVWGFWNSQHNSTDPQDNAVLAQMGSIYSNLTASLNQYGDKLDVIYNENLTQNNVGYSKLVYWNGTVVDYQKGSLQLTDVLPALAACAVFVGVALPILMFRKQQKQRLKTDR